MTESIYVESLRDRDLWVDGVETDNINSLCDKILSEEPNFLEDARISESNANEVKKFISLSDLDLEKSIKIKTKNSIKNLDDSFNIPEEYMEIDIEKYLVRKFRSLHDLSQMDNIEINDRLYRLSDELDLYHNMGLTDVLKCAIFIVDQMKSKNIVWGPGRGSACCSYILFLLEIHDIDSFFYELQIDEFLR